MKEYGFTMKVSGFYTISIPEKLNDTKSIQEFINSSICEADFGVLTDREYDGCIADIDYYRNVSIEIYGCYERTTEAEDLSEAEEEAERLFYEEDFGQLQKVEYIDLDIEEYF